MKKHERVKHLRKDVLKLTQQQFADTLGISRSNLGNIEINQIALTERNAKDICEKFHINEEWLLEGVGDIFENRNASDEIIDFAADLIKIDDDAFKKRLITALARLDESSWNVLEKLIDDINVENEKG